MPKTLLLNYILSDGYGDYYHYHDIENALSHNQNINPQDLFSIIWMEATPPGIDTDKKYAQIQKN